MRNVTKTEQAIVQSRKCPLCEQNAIRKLTSLHFLMWDDLNMDGHAELVSCQQCGMVYNDTVASEDDFNRYYEKNAYYAVADTLGSGGLGDHEKRRYETIYTRLKPFFLHNNPCIVDVGSGKGGFLTWCKQAGLTNLIAVEQSTFCVEVINQDDITVFNNLKQLIDNIEQVDVVILSHILEHVFYPVTFLKDLVELASPNTVFYIEVPNADYYIADFNPWMYLYFEHINHFDGVHLQNLISQVGLSVIWQDETPFIPGLETEKAGECIAMVCKKNKAKTQSFYNQNLANTMAAKLAGRTALTDQLNTSLRGEINSISIWGVSQYIQLLLGSIPKLQEKLKFLVDKSPAKQGRFLGRNKIFAPEKLTELEKDDVLMIPASIYGQEIERYLEDMKIKVQIKTI